MIGLLIVLPLLGAQLGLDLSVVSRALAISTRVLHVAGDMKYGLDSGVQNKPLYLDHPQFEGFEVLQTVRRGADAVA